MVIITLFRIQIQCIWIHNTVQEGNEIKGQSTFLLKKVATKKYQREQSRKERECEVNCVCILVPATLGNWHEALLVDPRVPDTHINH